MKRALLFQSFLLIFGEIYGQNAFPEDSKFLFQTDNSGETIYFFGADTLEGFYLKSSCLRLSQKKVLKTNQGMKKFFDSEYSTQMNDSTVISDIPSKSISKLYLFNDSKLLDVLNEYEEGKYCSENFYFYKGSLEFRKSQIRDAYQFTLVPKHYKLGRRLFDRIHALKSCYLLDSTTKYHYLYPGSFEVTLESDSVGDPIRFMNEFNLKFRDEAYLEFNAGGPDYSIAQIKSSEEFSKKFTLYPKSEEWRPAKWAIRIEAIVQDKNEILKLIESLRYE